MTPYDISSVTCVVMAARLDHESLLDWASQHPLDLITLSKVDCERFYCGVCDDHLKHGCANVNNPTSRLVKQHVRSSKHEKKRIRTSPKMMERNAT